MHTPGDRVAARVRFVIAASLIDGAQGREVHLEMRLENVSSADVVVNARLAVAPVIGDVRPEVFAGKRECPFLFRVRLAPLRRESFVRLAPGTSVGGSYLLSRGYDLGAPGRYRIRATYVSDETWPDLSASETYTGELISNEIHIVIP